MNEQNENEKPKSNKKASPEPIDKGQPVIVIRHGAVAASVWKRQSPSGYAYYDFSLSRSWKSLSTEKAGYSQNFFTRNKEALQSCVVDAIAWIQAHQTEESEQADAETLAA